MDLYRDQLLKPHTSVVECDFDAYFDQQVKELEGIGENVQTLQSTIPNDISPPSSSNNRNEKPPPVPGLLFSEFMDIILKATGTADLKNL